MSAVDEPESLNSKRNVSDGLLALTDQAFVSLNSFVTVFLVARLCESQDINLYALAWSILNFFRVIQERTLAAPYFVFAHEKDRNASTFLGSSLTHQGVFAIASSLLFVFAAAFFAIRQYPEGIATCLLVLVAAAPFVLLRDHLRAVSCAHFNYKAAVMLSGGALFLQVGFMLAAWQAGMLNVFVVLAVMGLASLIACGFWLYVRTQHFEFDKAKVLTDWNTTKEYSKWLVAARAFPTAASSALPWIVLWCINEDASGLLLKCLTLANVALMFLSGANNFFLPRIVKSLNEKGPAAMVNVLFQSAIAFTVVLSALSLGFFVCGDWLIEVVLKGGPGDHGLVVGLLGVNFLIVSYSMVAGNGMTAIGKPEGLFWGELSYGIVALVMAVVLSPTWGLVGTAIALCLASLAATVVETSMLYFLLADLRKQPQVGFTNNDRQGSEQGISN